MKYTEKQLQIIEVAERLFASQGYNGTSVRDIAKEADVNVAMISYYFGSKENLLIALFEHRSLEMREQIEDTMQNQQLSPLEKVYKLIDTYVNRMLQKQHFHKIMVREQVTAETNVKQQIMQTKKNNQKLIRELILDGQKKGA